MYNRYGNNHQRYDNKATKAALAAAGFNLKPASASAGPGTAQAAPSESPLYTPVGVVNTDPALAAAGFRFTSNGNPALTAAAAMERAGLSMEHRHADTSGCKTEGDKLQAMADNSHDQINAKLSALDKAGIVDPAVKWALTRPEDSNLRPMTTDRMLAMAHCDSDHNEALRIWTKVLIDELRVNRKRFHCLWLYHGYGYSIERIMQDMGETKGNVYGMLTLDDIRHRIDERLRKLDITYAV